ncbi:MAG TPA: TIGR04076 family protein [Deltaproteobacteria bacterium]|nr:TIGR04076 family protein [Deltaproteobacteria bacterium]
MAKDPGIGFAVTAEVVSVRGFCSAGLEEGQRFPLSCHDPSGLCGFFYHDIFPSLQCFQFGGTMPWWQGDTIELSCPDVDNLVTIRLTRRPRE